MRLTTAQALIAFLANQFTVDRIDGQEYRKRLIPGTFGIFGHGNVAGVGQALKQAQVHQAVGYARHTRRRATFAVSTSIGPGSTNMVTGAALATTNRLPALLLPSDIFATRVADPVLQQLERYDAGDVSVNDAFRPVSKYFDRVSRPEQLFSALLNGLRVLTDPAETGAVTISLPQDVQAEAFDFPDEFLAEREWRIRRPDAEREDIAEAARRIRAAKRPLIIAGGGVLYAFADEQLAALAAETGIPVSNTQAGVGVLPWDHPQALGAIGSTGTTAANAMASRADLIIGIGTRYEDFTASRTAFQNPDVSFININVAAFDAYKLGTSLPIVADAGKALAALREALSGFQVAARLTAEIGAQKARWNAIADAAFAERSNTGNSQNAIIGVVNNSLDARDVLVCAAGSLPGDLHKLWRVQDPFGYHVEYAYSCMGYEIPGGLGVKRAVLAEHTEAGTPLRDVVVIVGDGSYLMMHTELVTAVAEGIKLIVVLIQNHGYASIGALSASLGSQKFGTQYRALDSARHSFDDGPVLPVDLASNAASLGVRVVKAADVEELSAALGEAKALPEGSGPILIYLESDPLLDGPSSESWWDVPVASTSELASTQEAYRTYIEHKTKQRPLLGDPEQSS